MGQCVTKCKNPTSSLGSKSGDKEGGSKAHHKKSSSSCGGGHKEETSALCSKGSGELSNGTKAPDVSLETAVVPSVTRDPHREEPAADRDGLSLARIEQLFCGYKDQQDDAILEEGMERFCNDLRVDPAEFRVLVIAWKFQAATMCKFTRTLRLVSPLASPSPPFMAPEAEPCTCSGTRTIWIRRVKNDVLCRTRVRVGSAPEQRRSVAGFANVSETSLVLDMLFRSGGAN